MSENPYAADYSEDVFSDEPSRTSVMAILSLVCSLICCIPGLGVLAVLLGIGALVGIGASGGRVGGKMLAVAGLVIGALVSFVWVGIWIAVMVGANQAIVLGDFVDYAQKDDVATAGPYLDSAITDAQIIAWGDAVEAEWGPFVSRPQSAGEALSGWMSMGQHAGAQNVLTPGASILPLTIEMRDGTAVAGFTMTQSGVTGPSGMPLLTDVAITTPDGGVLRLSDFGADGTPPADEAESELPDMDEPGTDEDPDGSDPDGDDGDGNDAGGP